MFRHTFRIVMSTNQCLLLGDMCQSLFLSCHYDLKLSALMIFSKPE